jgi:threonine/homoserine efflux transporter RhtA
MSSNALASHRCFFYESACQARRLPPALGVALAFVGPLVNA